MKTRFIFAIVSGCLVALSSPILFSVHAQSSSFPRNLTLGDTGSDVSALQQFLITNNFLHVATPTGYFGSLTQASVAVWQGTASLPTTGYFGPLSRAELEVQLAAQGGSLGSGG